jgi:hypothetical protein
VRMCLTGWRPRESGELTRRSRRLESRYFGGYVQIYTYADGVTEEEGEVNVDQCTCDTLLLDGSEPNPPAARGMAPFVLR